jgi:hypothetical protein
MSSSTGASVKVLACRFDERMYGQLVAVAGLEDKPLVDVVRDALEDYLKRRVADGSLKAKAEEAKAKIQQEATDRLGSIDELLAGTTTTGKVVKVAK